MTPTINLDIEAVPPEFTRLRHGGLYWIGCADPQHTDAIARAALAGSGGLAHAVLAEFGGMPDSMLAGLPEAAGPAECTLYRANAPSLLPAMHGLVEDLARATRRGPALCLVRLAFECIEALTDAQLAAWCRQLAEWSGSSCSTLLMLVHGSAPTLAPRLLPLNRDIDGVAQWFPNRAGSAYFIHYWSSPVGVVANREFEVREVAGRLQRNVEAELPAPTSRFDDADRFVFHADERVLEGSPPPSPAWQLHEDWNQLMAHALQAHAATVVFGVDGNAEIDELARLVYRLRHERGERLKLVVRETAPCFRYVDEKLLLEFGANLVVPADTPLPRFLTQLEALENQRWQGTLPADPEPLIRARRAPDVMGVVSPARFRTLAQALVGRSLGDAENMVLALQPVAGLRPEHALRECRIRRRGDFACVYKREVWLFLFACRADGIESALDNLSRLPWRDIFQGYRRLSEYHVEEMEGVPEVDATSWPLQAASAARVDPHAADGPLEPRPLRLGKRA